MIAETENLSEVLEIFQTAQTIITCLFRLSHAVRKATKRDRYAASSRKRKDPYDELFDIAHVGNKYPKLRETPWLEARLGRAITRRREFIRYSKEHYHKLARGLEENEKEEAQVVTMKQTSPQNQGPALLASVAGPSFTLQSSLGSTKASTLDPTQLLAPKEVAHHEMTDDQVSESSYATTEIIAENEGALKVPPIPEEAEGGNDFVCPYCWTAISFRGNSKHRRKYWM